MMINLIIRLIILTTILQQTSTFQPFKIINRNKYVNTIRYSPDGRYLASTEKVIGLSVYSTDDYSLVNSTNIDFADGVNNGFALDYSNDQTLIAYSVHRASPTKIRIINANNELTINLTIDTGINYIRDLDFNQDGTKILACGEYGYAIYQVSDGA